MKEEVHGAESEEVGTIGAGLSDTSIRRPKPPKADLNDASLAGTRTGGDDV